MLSPRFAPNFSRPKSNVTSFNIHRGWTDVTRRDVTNVRRYPILFTGRSNTNPHVSNASSRAVALGRAVCTDVNRSSCIIIGGARVLGPRRRSDRAVTRSEAESVSRGCPHARLAWRIDNEPGHFNFNRRHRGFCRREPSESTNVTALSALLRVSRFSQKRNRPLEKEREREREKSGNSICTNTYEIELYHGWHAMNFNRLLISIGLGPGTVTFLSIERRAPFAFRNTLFYRETNS